MKQKTRERRETRIKKKEREGGSEREGVKTRLRERKLERKNYERE